MKLFKIKPRAYSDLHFQYVVAEDVQTAIEKWRDARSLDQVSLGYDADVVVLIKDEVIV